MKVKVTKPPIEKRWEAMVPGLLNTIGQNGSNQAKLLVRVETANLKGSIDHSVSGDSVKWGTDVKYSYQQEGYKDESLAPRSSSQEKGGWTPYLKPSLEFVSKNLGIFVRRAFRSAFR